MNKTTSYLAWAVGLLDLPFLVLIPASTQIGNSHQHLLASLVCAILLIQAVCLFLYRVSARTFSNSIFNKDIDFSKPKKVLQELLFMPGYVLCYISTTLAIFFLLQTFTYASFDSELPPLVELSISAIGTIFIFVFLPKIIINYYRHVFGKMFY
ncbi:MAG: hypothetical protein WCI52_03870 [bacterium]